MKRRKYEKKRQKVKNKTLVYSSSFSSFVVCNCTTFVFLLCNIWINQKTLSLRENLNGKLLFIFNTFELFTYILLPLIFNNLNSDLLTVSRLFLFRFI